MRAVLILIVLGLVGPAFAEDVPPPPRRNIVIHEIDSESDAAGANPRTAALDDAFARAVRKSLPDVLDADAIKANKAVIDREIIGRARLWVHKFKVLKEETDSGRMQLTVSVSVDRDKMRDRLEELNIRTDTVVASPGTPTNPSGAQASVILMRISDGDNVRASFGNNRKKELPGMGALAAQLRKSGMTVKEAPATGTVRPAGLPLDDSEAEALLVSASADVAAIVGVTLGAPVPVRGVAVAGVLVTAHVRVIGKGKLIGEGVATVAARGSESSVVGAAIDRALVAAVSDAAPVKQTIGQPVTFTGDDTPIGESGVVLVRVAPKTPFALVASELKYLSGAKGISSAVLRRLSPSGWVIGVSTTESIQRIATIAKKAPSSSSAAQVKIVGDIVELTLTGAP